MYRNKMKIMFGEISLSPAILFMNSNKSERNLIRIIRNIRQECRPYGIELRHECIVNKGPDRNIDRDAINMLITLLITGKYEIVVVNKMTDLTNDISDLNEFIKDGSVSGICFFELFTRRFYSHVDSKNDLKEKRPIWDGESGC